MGWVGDWQILGNEWRLNWSVLSKDSAYHVFWLFLYLASLIWLEIIFPLWTFLPSFPLFVIILPPLPFLSQVSLSFSILIFLKLSGQRNKILFLSSLMQQIFIKFLLHTRNYSRLSKNWKGQNRQKSLPSCNLYFSNGNQVIGKQKIVKTYIKWW